MQEEVIHQSDLPSNTTEYHVPGVKVVKDPVVSVVMITYNHENFIEESVEGVMMQECDFPVELIISEDCSTDGTRAKCIELKNKYPYNIRLLLSEKNKGMSQNFLDALFTANGKFVALCEGDDYWSSKNKLRLQLDYLLKSGYSGCIHDFNISHRNEIIDVYRSPQIKYSCSEIIRSHPPFKLCTLLFKKDQLVLDKSWFTNHPITDWKTAINLSTNGDIGIMKDVMATYRVHGGGVWSGSDKVSQFKLAVLEIMTCYSNDLAKYRRELDLRKADISCRLCKVLFDKIKIMAVY